MHPTPHEGRPSAGRTVAAPPSCAPTRGLRAALGLVVILVMAGLTGCGGRSGDAAITCSNPAREVVEERPVDVPYRGPQLDADALVGASVPRLVVQLTNSQPSVERLRLAFDGIDALDVDLPESLGCGHGGAVFSIAYDPTPGPVEVQLDLQGATSTSTIVVPKSGTVWAVVDVQSEREGGDLTVYDSQPGWG